MPDPSRRKMNASQKRALKAAEIAIFVALYGRKAQKGREPNDRRHDVEFARALKQLSAEGLDHLLRDDE